MSKKFALVSSCDGRAISDDTTDSTTNAVVSCWGAGLLTPDTMRIRTTLASAEASVEQMSPSYSGASQHCIC